MKPNNLKRLIISNQLILFLFIISPFCVDAGWEIIADWKTGPKEYRNLNLIWGSSPQNIYFVGTYIDTGNIYRYDGKNWKKEKVTLPKYPGFHHVSGTGANNIFAVGTFGRVQDAEQGGLIIRYDGKSWRNITSEVKAVLPRNSSNHVFDKVLGLDSKNVFVAGSFLSLSSDDPNYYSSYAVILHFNGAKWSVSYQEENLYIYDIWGSGPDGIYAAGNKTVLISTKKGATTCSAVRHFDGKEWNPVQSLDGLGGAGSGFNSVAGFSRNNVFIAGSSGLFHGNGTNWNKLDAGAIFSRKLYAVDSQLYANMGDTGKEKLYRLDSGQWKKIPFMSYSDGEYGFCGKDGYLFVNCVDYIYRYNGRGDLYEPIKRPGGTKKLEDMDF